MFHLYLSDDKQNEDLNVEDIIAIRCNNFNKDIGLYSRNIKLKK